jgi:cytochrome c-type biogenesis protein CcmH
MVERLIATVLTALLLALSPGQPAFAREAEAVATDPALEARVMKLATELRCLVCQNQTIADSHADLAVDLRKQIREQLVQGRSEDQIRDYMTARYGDFVLYKPPFKPTTALLWVGPPLLLVGALIGLFLMLRARQRASPDAFDPDTPEDLADGNQARSPR